MQKIWQAAMEEVIVLAPIGGTQLWRSGSGRTLVVLDDQDFDSARDDPSVDSPNTLAGY